MAMQGWTTPADVLALLRRRWQAGTFLSAFAGGQPFEPPGVPVRGPAPGELAERFSEVREWTAQWERADHALLRLEYRKVGGRAFGSNSIPCRAWIDSYDRLWSLLRVGRDVRAFTDLVDATRLSCPRLAGWMIAHPMRVLGLAGDWAEITGTVRWIDERQPPGAYLRQVDVPGVDTKFIERHRGVLADLLDLQLDAGRIDPAEPRSNFAGRYRFRGKPEYVRFRLARPGLRLSRAGLGIVDAETGPVQAGSGELTELSVRVGQLAAAPPGISTVYVVENEITYLAFPLADHAMVIFGGGYAVSALESLSWLADADLAYWGDIDTHGFAILNRLRHAFPHARSMLMDRTTLLAHRSQWVREPSPVSARLDRLSPDEAGLYRDLTENALGQAVRLEQERIRYSAIEQELRTPTHSPADRR